MNNEEKIAFVDLKAQYAELKPVIDERIQRVLNHGQYIMGPEVQELEEKLATLSGARHCVSVSSGTEALLISMMALGIGVGDEVITTPFTFAATVETIALLGATPVFVDIEPGTCNLDATLLEAAISPKTKAIMPVSLYGQACDMDEINNIAERHGDIPVIEDAAQSFGAEYRGKKSGNLSGISCTSFFPSKPLGCYGDGGAIFTNNDRLAQIMREIRVHGQERRYIHTRIGVGGRMDTLQCAIVLAKLETFALEIARRNEAAAQYRTLMKDLPSIVSPVVKPDRTCVWAQYTIQVDNRAEVIESLARSGIPTATHYPLSLHQQPAFSALCRVSGETRHSEAAARRVLSLPMHPYLTVAEQNRIVNALAVAVA